MQISAAPEEQQASTQQPGAANALGGQQERIPPARSVRPEHLGADRNELVAGGRARGLGPMADVARPRDVGGSVEGVLPERTKVEILTQRDPALVIGDRADPLEVVLAAEDGVSGRLDQAQKGSLLDGQRLSPGRGQLTPSPTGLDVQQASPEGGDHRAPPIGTPRPAPMGVSSSHARTMAPKASGCSSMGAWPHRFSTTSSEPRMRSWKRSATASGVIRSSRPHTSRVGTLMSPRRPSTLSRLAARATRSKRKAVAGSSTDVCTAFTHSGVTSEES